jgi:OpgC protein
MVFLDHIPYDFLNWFTIRNYGFSDAAEIFVTSDIQTRGAKGEEINKVLASHHLGHANGVL